MPSTSSQSTSLQRASDTRPVKHRTIWISDVHLGHQDCRADFLLDFLDNNLADKIYVLGDLIDLWALKRKLYWPDSHQAVINKLVKLAGDGVEVIYIPGNHDDLNRSYVGKTLLGVKILRNDIHETADGRRFFLCHGDEFDVQVRHSKLLSLIGDWAYDVLLFSNRWCNRLRGLMDLPYWSLSTFVKNRMQSARNVIDVFEKAAAVEASRQGCDGIVCGHIHQPELTKISGVLYCNDGDWIESCTAMAENSAGWLEILHWGDVQQSVKLDSASVGPIMNLPKAA